MMRKLFAIIFIFSLLSNNVIAIEADIFVQSTVNRASKLLSENISKGNRVELRGFGTFGLKELKARKSRNPRTGATVFVESKRIPYFRMGKKLKERINR